jgi:hypothetical protein
LNSAGQFWILIVWPSTEVFHKVIQFPSDNLHLRLSRFKIRPDFTGGGSVKDLR